MEVSGMGVTGAAVTWLLDAAGVRVSYGGRPALRGIDLTVGRGEVVAVVGESGSGKSTFAHAVVGLLPPGGRIDGGTLRFDGQELTALGPRGMRALRGRDIALVPQDPMVSLNPVQRVGTQVAEVLVVHGLAGRGAARLAAVELLAQAGLPDPAVRARQYPHELSGGMRQRVLIAIALAARPKLLIADEPTSALDATVQRQILDHLDTLTRELGTAVLLITHDLGVAAERASRVVVMSQGRVVETGAAREILESPRHDYTRALVAAAPGLRPRRLVTRDREPRTPPPDLLVAESLVKDFPLPRASAGPRTVRAVDRVSFTVPAGRTVALVGESGSGKSTTARLVTRLAEPTAGRVLFEGEDLTALGRRELRPFRRRMALVHQNPYASLDPRFTAAEIVAEPLRIFGVGGRRSRRERARELLARVALPPALHDRRPARLSGGQRQRVAIARALALEPALVVCDEPVSGLDVSVQAQVLELLAALQAELNVSYLFISHDLAVVRQIADHVVVMKDGTVAEAGETGPLFAEPRHDYTRALLAAVPGQRARPVAPAGDTARVADRARAEDVDHAGERTPS
ncbi:ABC transporter ATP-binding protein [Microbispora sp. NPDC088329]|uniref:ABC transporter ATP-binding protein n=1 Tax=Microbispora sp. NPDC088329 TaxID=3154869 RepID=UPI00343CB32E